MQVATFKNKVVLKIGGRDELFRNAVVRAVHHAIGTANNQISLEQRSMHQRDIWSTYNQCIVDAKACHIDAYDPFIHTPLACHYWPFAM